MGRNRTDERTTADDCVGVLNRALRYHLLQAEHWAAHGDGTAAEVAAAEHGHRHHAARCVRALSALVGPQEAQTFHGIANRAAIARVHGE